MFSFEKWNICLFRLLKCEDFIFFSLSFRILNEKLLGFGLSVGQYLVKSLILSTFHNMKNEQND